MNCEMCEGYFQAGKDFCKSCGFDLNSFNKEEEWVHTCDTCGYDLDQNDLIHGYHDQSVYQCAECYDKDKEEDEEEEEEPPLIIKLNRNMYYEDRELGGLFCGANLKVNTELFIEGEPFQNPKSKSYNKIKRLTLRNKDAIIDFV